MIGFARNRYRRAAKAPDDLPVDLRRCSRSARSTPAHAGLPPTLISALAVEFAFEGAPANTLV